MAGTRGLAKFKGSQLNSTIMRNRHFDESNKISENYIDIDFNSHREILEDTKIDVFSQVNNKNVAGLSEIDITDDLGGKVESTGNSVEGVVTGVPIELRVTGTEDSSFIDPDGDRVYGKVTAVNNEPVSVTGEVLSGEVDGVNDSFTFANGNIVDGSETIYIDGNEQTSGYTVDYVNGTLVFDTPPSSGESITADYDHDQDGNGAFILKFYSEVDGAETPYTFSSDADNLDYRYILRTNMSIIPVDAIINGGAGFVEGATDANAYMNLNQLMKDLYGSGGTLDNDGNANLETSIIKQIADEIQARSEADQAIVDDLASNADAKGANLVGVEVDAEGNYVGTTVQEVITELANKIASNQADLNDRVTHLETKLEEEVYEATGEETSYTLVKGKAEDKSVLLFINGQLQAPGINFEYVTDVDGNITGFDFSPDTLDVVDGVPDVLFVKYNKIQD